MNIYTANTETSTDIKNRMLTTIRKYYISTEMCMIMILCLHIKLESRALF